ncbi:MAG: phosphonopyruvate decarboxylase [Candidatus Cloacimonetes bacterium]|nr:phosphonopyruvate decarboxylase [Candidatus Cloacimonadota bacterium]
MEPRKFVDFLASSGFSPYVGVPCSVFTNLLNYLRDISQEQSYVCSSEGEAMGMAGGFALSGKIPVVYMQNDGYGNAVNPLSSLQLLYRLPALLLISWRAEPGRKDAPQHRIMGETILELLEIFRIPYDIITAENLENSIQKAKDHCVKKELPYAFIIRRGFFAEYNRQARGISADLHQRMDYLEILEGRINEKDILLGATGFSGRELYQSINHRGKFYMMGSMGCLASLGLALAIENQHRNIFVLDGDGALLMKMGTLSTIGYHQPANLIHICFDNCQYESTGGQCTTSLHTDFGAIARACGYKFISVIDTPDVFDSVMGNIEKLVKPCFLHIRVKPGTISGLTRPEDSPELMRDNLRNFLKSELD